MFFSFPLAILIALIEKNIRIARHTTSRNATISKKPAIFVDSQGNPTEVKVLDNTGVNGNYISSRGLEGNDVWGTRSEWVKLYSIIEDEPVSITIIDPVSYTHLTLPTKA